MPMNRADYPDDWEAIALAVKTAANWTCQQCGKECRKSGEDLLTFIYRTSGGCHSAEDYERLEHPQRFTLTVAHLDHDPWNPNARLKALCAPCHGRYDLKALPTKRRLKRERLGQLTLFSDIAGQGKDFAKVQPTIFEGGDRNG